MPYFPDLQATGVLHLAPDPLEQREEVLLCVDHADRLDFDEPPLDKE
jgi:hypothetical protein